MLGQQIKLLIGLYWSPVKAASRIIDEGRLWFSVIAAALALVWMRAVAVPGAAYIADSAMIIKVLAALMRASG